VPLGTVCRMPKKDRPIHADPEMERLLTSATALTFLRTVVSLGFVLAAVRDESLTLLVTGLAVYWVGDILDGEVARWRNCETRIGAVIDMLCDRLNCAGFYLGLAWLQPIMAIPVSVYLFEFMVIDMFLSLAFLAWPIRSPNYFYAVDHRIWVWNWSRPGKAANSGLFAVLLLVTGWWWLGLVIALGLVILKCISLRWLLQLGIPVPTGAIGRQPA
jgi:CDP-diacylglycerol--glycerol-3-phosphate 3-phosphatidyltransferase